jgi:hypothetical protein
MYWNLSRKHLWKVFYQACSFRFNLFTNMAPQAILGSDWSLSKKFSPLKPIDQMNWNLVGSIYEGSSIMIAHFVQIRSQACPPRQSNSWLISKKSSPPKPLCQVKRNLVGSTYGRFLWRFLKQNERWVSPTDTGSAHWASSFILA